jgi:glutamate 5-kinase
MLANAKRIVIKVGSSLLVEGDGALRAKWLAAFSEDIAALKADKMDIILVTSGAIALGRAQLGLKAKSLLHLEEKQAAAACGQITLFTAWREALAKHDIAVGQLLLTADDSIHRRRYLNARNTIDTLLELGAVPVINENDTVATAEIRFGDNDRLSARVAQMAGADLLVLFSDIDGLYTADPNKHKDAKFIEEVKEITPQIEAMAGDAASALGSGGMATKIAAAKIATGAGCSMLIARGTENHALKTLQSGGKHTRFTASENPTSARKRWIAGSVHPAGSVTVDDGAAKALAAGKSLLPAGVTTVEGAFIRGDTVLIKNAEDEILGKGLVAYDAADAARIIGKKSAEIEKILGFHRRDVLIHRDDLVLE